MALFTHPEFDGHEEVVFCHEKPSGLKAIIAIHNTRRGPALGGCRMWPYAGKDGGEAEALTDVLRLSRGMTYKSALAELPYGGGKSVVIGDPRRHKTEALLGALARSVDSLGGRYIIAEDVGINLADAEVMERHTRYVAGTRSGGAGDPSPSTAYGVYMGIKAATAHKLGRESMRGVRVAVQGLGQVGYHLCQYLADDGASLIVTDINRDAVERAVRELGARGVAPEAIYDAEAEIFAPCALGAVINDRTLPRLKVAIVAGSANNQLAEARHGVDLAKAGILYAPDYAINAGGVINISHEGRGYDKDTAFRHVARIHDTLREIFRRAEADRIPTAQAADALALERLNAVSAAA
jgi:leucine dehydrogenase